MKFEYIIFNMLILSGPLLLSFDKRVSYVSNWPKVFVALSVPLVPFIIWDSLVTGRHWWFNEAYTTNIKILNLPPGEWLFFVSVPFACLFIWDCLGAYLPNFQVPQLNRFATVLFSGFVLGPVVFLIGKEYTGLVLFVLAIVALLDRRLDTGLFLQSKTYQFIAIIIVLTLFCNGYLTARPVVLYDPIYQLDIRIGTIPIEDFGYGIALLLLCTIFYEKLKALNKTATAEMQDHA